MALALATGLLVACGATGPAGAGDEQVLAMDYGRMLFDKSQSS